MDTPGIGAFVQPQPGAVAPGAPQPQADLHAQWTDFFKNPQVQSGLFQLGTSLLSSMDSQHSFPTRIGFALNDAGRAVGNTTEFQAKEAAETARQAQENQRIGLEGKRVDQEATNAENTKQYQAKSLSQNQSQFQAGQTLTRETNAQNAALKAEELANSKSYQTASIALQQEQLKATSAGIQTPRGRALQQLLKSATAQAGLDPNFDQDTYIDNGMQAIDKMFPGTGDGSPTGSTVPGGAPPVAAGSGTPAPAAAGTPAAAPAPAGTAVGTTATNPKTKAKVQWDGTKWVPLGTK